MQSPLERHWHQLPAPELLALLDADEARGLDVFEAEQRRARYGENVLRPPATRPAVVVFLLQFHQPLVYILLGAAAITALLGEWVDSSVILGVVLVNAAIGFMQESRATKAIAALARSMDLDARVVRAGREQRVAARALVPGDIVLLAAGAKVPADLRLLRGRELRVDESALTGESVPVHKRPDDLVPETMLAERHNMAYASTLVTYGTGRGVVVATGEQTEIGRIQELIAGAEVLATPLTRRIAAFSAVLLWIILALAALTFVVGVARGEPALDMFMAAVALAVGAIPEGLPAAMTITLAIGVARMARRHAIVRKLPAVETLGSTTVICSDKTGTLTQNQMTVQAVYAGGEHFAVAGVGYAPEGGFARAERTVLPANHPALQACLLAGVLCNDARLVQGEAGWQVEGDPTEGALLSAAAKAGLDTGTLPASHRRLDAVPFESEHQYMATLHAWTGRDARVVFVKGSAERVLERCGDAIDAEGTRTALDVHAVHREVAALAARGLRVLAFARRELPDGTNTLDHADVAAGLTFVGLQGMIDPPRPEAVRAVRACRGAGIQVKMITGDHAGTAVAVGQALGMGEPPDALPHVMGGDVLAALSDAELTERVESVAVFARVAPDQKLRLVQALQARGHVVAMTGDGVNDAPALRRADIGVAMGLGGTEVAKEAADMVLTNDNFSTIEAAVEEGRAVYDNLVKFITWTLPTNIGEGLVILVAVFAGVALPITPVQILWVNMTTAVCLGLMLAFERKEPGIMHRAPRDPRTPVLTRALVLRMLVVGVLLLLGAFGLFRWELAHGASEAAARTVAVNVFVFGELFYLFNCRSLTRSMFALGVFTNRWLLGGVAAMVLAQLVFTYLPFMQVAFGTEAIGVREWAMILATGLTIYVVVGLEKWARNRWLDTRAGTRAAA